MTPNEALSPEIQSEAATFNLKSEVSRAIETTPEQITFHNAPEYIAGETRFLYGFTTEGFVKAAKEEGNKGQLAREAAGTAIANTLGIPSVEMLHPYQETPEGQGVVHLEKLAAENGEILNTPEAIAAEDSVYGRKVGEIFMRVLAPEIPPGIDTSQLSRTNWKNDREKFWNEWHTRAEIVTSDEHSAVRENLLPREKLAVFMRDFEENFGHTLDTSDQPGKEYFAHNDTAPSNMYVGKAPNGEDDIRILDYEHAGVSNNRELVYITELANFYARCWPNPEMQQEFLRGCLRSEANNLDHAYQRLKGVAIFGVTSLAKFAMNPDNREHPMARSLLANLESNLTYLDEVYRELSEQQKNEQPPQELELAAG